MCENRDFIPTELVDLNIREDGSRVMIIQRGTPYQDENWTIPGSEMQL